MNKVLLVGRLTRDPELRKSSNNLSILNFSLGINRNFTNSKGERVADFINCVAFQRIAENMATYTVKGSLVSVEGRLQSRSYDDATGKRVYVTEVVAETVQFLSRPTGASSQPNPNVSQPSYSKPTYNQSNPETNSSNEGSFFSDFKQFDDDSKDILSDLDISDDSLPF
ncbi:MAG: single-stranded DNA-binding protein [Bacilli bacterium]|jgi:single-strand DNA-binding protein|nr:single-stranded DNA-binding protein [Bacilli bacterium]